MTDEDYIQFIRLVSLNLETTNKCLLRCPLCERVKETPQRSALIKKLQDSRDIPLDDVEKLLKYFNRVNFCGQISDPIYHKNFLDILKLINNYRTNRIFISTNGSGKTKEWFAECFAAAPKVCWVFAMDGLPSSSATYRINQQSEHVFEIMKMGAEMGAEIVWKYIVFKYNEHEITEAKLLAKQYRLILQLAKTYRWTAEIQPSKEWQSSDKWVKYAS